jgi:hypothetical protein
MYTVESFTLEFATTALPGVKLSTNDIQVLLKYLQRDKRALVKDGEVRALHLRMLPAMHSYRFFVGDKDCYHGRRFRSRYLGSRERYPPSQEY